MREHYYDFDYDFKRLGWFSYYYQLKEVSELIMELKNHKKEISVLEVGIGNGTVSDYLRKREIKITTLDVDLELKPDILMDIRQSDLKENSFDVILCAEVLEHMPFKDFSVVLPILWKTARKYVVLTLPEVVDGVKKCAEHFWEIGLSGCEKKEVGKIISDWFIIRKQYNLPYWNYHTMYVLEKRKQ